jgi:threonine dehydrogenase-like Zn-dependent dehydrogenase
MNAEFDNPFYPWTLRFTNELSLEYIKQKRINVDALVSHRIAPTEAPDVYMQLLSNRSDYTGVIIDWTKLYESQ